MEKPEKTAKNARFSYMNCIASCNTKLTPGKRPPSLHLCLNFLKLLTPDFQTQNNSSPADCAIRPVSKLELFCSPFRRRKIRRLLNPAHQLLVELRHVGDQQVVSPAAFAGLCGHVDPGGVQSAVQADGHYYIYRWTILLLSDMGEGDAGEQMPVIEGQLGLAALYRHIRNPIKDARLQSLVEGDGLHVIGEEGQEISLHSLRGRP